MSHFLGGFVGSLVGEKIPRSQAQKDGRDELGRAEDSTRGSDEVVIFVDVGFSVEGVLFVRGVLCVEEVSVVEVVLVVVVVVEVIFVVVVLFAGGVASCCCMAAMWSAIEFKSCEISEIESRIECISALISFNFARMPPRWGQTMWKGSR